MTGGIMNKMPYKKLNDKQREWLVVIVRLTEEITNQYETSTRSTAIAPLHPVIKQNIVSIMQLGSYNTDISEPDMETIELCKIWYKNYRKVYPIINKIFTPPEKARRNFIT